MSNTDPDAPHRVKLKRTSKNGFLDAEFDASIKAQNALRSLKVEYLPVAALWPALRTVRTHTKKQVRQLADSVTHFGFVRPIIVDARGQIVAGHGVWEAAKTLRLAEVPAIRISHLSDVEIRAYMLADNKLAEKAGWDRELLAIELKELEGLLPQIDLDLSITGFDSAEIDALMFDFGNERPNPADEIPDRHDGPAVSRLGDLFVFGKKHRLAVGDAQDPEGYPKLLRSELAAMAFLDPPYNVPIAGHVGGRGRTKHREFACAAGELTERQFIAFLEESLALCAKHSADGAIHYVCMDWRHCHELHVAGTRVFTELKNVCVWVKTNAGQGSFYRSQHELVFVFKHGTAPHLNTFELGQHGRSRSNVWQYAGVNTFRAGRMDELQMHPTVKPVALVVDAMRDCSRRGDIVLDAFAGSGTTIIAAEKIGRRAYCMELDPGYVDVAIRRWQRFTGKDAILEATGQTFDELEHQRVRNPTPRQRLYRKRAGSEEGSR